MVKVWDYFMRRKGLLLVLLIFFVGGYLLSCQVLRRNPQADELTYIKIDNWGEEVEIPRTGGKLSMPIVAVMDPEEILKLENPKMPDAQTMERPPISPEDEDFDNTNQDLEIPAEDNAWQDDSSGQNGDDSLDADFNDPILDNIIHDEKNEKSQSNGTNPNTTQITPSEFISNIAMFLIVVVFCGYLTEQHFMR